MSKILKRISFIAVAAAMAAIDDQDLFNKIGG